MTHSQITFNAELNDDEIVIKLSSENGDRELAKKAASRLFDSLKKVGIEVTKQNLEKLWNLES